MYMFICYNTCMFTALSKVQVPNKMTETAGLFFYTGTEYDNACSLATSSPKNYKAKLQ